MVVGTPNKHFIWDHLFKPTGMLLDFFSAGFKVAELNAAF